MSEKIEPAAGGALRPLDDYRFAIRRPVTILMIFVTLMVFGWRSYQELPLNLMPDMSYPTLTVRTEYEGAAPEDVEKLVTRPVEERLSIVNGVVELSSVSSAGLSEVVLEFKWGTNMDIAMQDVRESLDLFDPPEGVTKKPIILRYDPTLDPVMRVALLGRDVSHVADSREREATALADLTEIRHAAERYLKGDLEAETGIAQVRVTGGRQEEIQILLDSERLKALNLKPEEVVLALQRQNVNLSGGRLKEGRTEYLVRTLNEFADIEAVRGVIVGTRTGGQFRLDELARVDMGTRERDAVVRVNGQEVVELAFFKEGNANVVRVSETLRKFFGFTDRADPREKVLRLVERVFPNPRVEEMLESIKRQQLFADRLRTRLPGYVKPVLITDQARFIEASIREVKNTARDGGLISLLILFVFLRELRTTLIIGAAIPISVVATFVPMFMGQVSINIMSLGGLALGIGMLVDNSIVVLESIYRCREEGDSILDAAERGTKEVAGPVFASTLTTIAVFFPIAFVEGIGGQIFRDLALTVTFSLLASLMVSLLLNPMIASREGVRLFAPGAQWWLVETYRAGRAEGGSRTAAVRGLIGASRRRAAEELRGGWRNTAERAVERLSRGPGMPARIAGALMLLPLLLLFLVWLVLRSLAAIAVTLITAFVVVFGGLYVLISRALKLLLALPLRAMGALVDGTRTVYSKLLRASLRVGPVVLLVMVGLAIHAATLLPKLGRELIPPMKQGEFSIRVEAPPGTRLEDTERRAGAIEKVLSDFPEVDTITVQAGTDDANAGADEGENIATMTVKLKNPAETAKFQDGIIERMRQQVLAVSPDPVTFTLPSLFSFKMALEVQIIGEDLDTLRELGRASLAALDGVPGLQDLDLSLKRGYPEVHVLLDRELLASKNIEPFQVAQMLRTEVRGDIATRFNRAGDKVDIRVRADQERMTSLDDLRNLSVVDGYPPTPLSSVARVDVEDGPSEIRRIDQRQVVLVTGNVEGRDLGGVAGEVEARLERIDWPAGYSFALGGQNRELETSYNGLLFALALAMFLVYVVMACQFESLWQPFLIMCTVPLALIGVVYTLALTHINVSVVVFIGGIVLAGIVVNAAIIMVDYINQLRQRGMKKTEAIVHACTVRFRPIVMTRLTSTLGLIPMAISTGEGAEIRAPLAITVMGGLASDTILILFMMPIVYHLFAGRDKA
jgi:HAE1 family hydrophobic/amphiphilic exporter-1